MSDDSIAAWIAAAASIGSAGVAWFAQKGAARVAASAERQASVIEGKTDVWNNDKSIYVERVTAERAVWRSELRATVARLVSIVHIADGSPTTATRFEVAQIAMRLNPAGFSEKQTDRDAHPLDRDIHAILEQIIAGKSGPDQATKLERAVALLLKQEWQKSKREAERSLIP